MNKMVKYTDETKLRFEMRSEDNACVQIWKWDLTVNKRGPISVETQWKQWIIDEWENKERFSKQK